MIGEEHRIEAHLKIGRLLSANIKEDLLEEKILDVTCHLNTWRHLMTSLVEKTAHKIQFDSGIKGKVFNYSSNSSLFTGDWNGIPWDV